MSIAVEDRGKLEGYCRYDSNQIPDRKVEEPAAENSSLEVENGEFGEAKGKWLYDLERPLALPIFHFQ